MMKPTTDDYSLAARARSGDHDAVEALVERLRVRLFAHAYSVLRHYQDAQDAVAEALLQVCLHIEDLNEPANVVSWMQSIVHREAVRLQRKAPTSPIQEHLLPNAADDIGTLLLRMEIERALKRLPGLQAQAVRLFYMEGLSVNEIAQRLSVKNEGTVKVWLHRARRHLTAELGGPIPVNTNTAHAPVPRPAAILHTDLSAGHLAAITQALQTAGFEPDVFARQDLLEYRVDQVRLTDALARFHVIVVDETLDGRSGLEYVLFCKSNPETSHIPITLLHSQEENALLSTACFAAGVAHLVYKEDVHAITAAFMSPETPIKGDWASFTERAQRIVIAAQEVAISRGENCVSTEHVLLGLLQEPDSSGARLIGEAIAGISLKTIAEAVIELPPSRNASAMLAPLTLTPRSKNVLDFAQSEAAALGHRYVGSEHLLLGLLRERDGVAAQVLTNYGMTLDRTRSLIAAAA